MGRQRVREIDGSGARIAEVGGKAASLDRLVAMGFPVPPAVVLSASAYHEFVALSGLEGYLRGLALEDPEGLGDAGAVDDAFASVGVPGELEASIRRATAGLLERGPVAVRSSATAEDLASASFAGQYRTLLDVGSEEAVLDAVRACWASLWSPSARAYRRRAGVDDEGLAMGVIVQTMVPAEWAGVLFTRDPGGDPELARVEAVRGLGEQLVSGRVTPEDFLVERATLAVRASDEVGVVPPFLEDLLRLGVRIERRFGSPQDIEWAFADGELWVVQTRPITITGIRRHDDDGFDTEPGPGSAYTPIGVQEMLPGVLPPLLWTINAPMLDEGFRRLFGQLGIRVRDGAPVSVLGRFRSRAALNLSTLRDAAASTPGGSRAEVERQYLGRAISEEAEEVRAGRGGIRGLLAGLRAVRTRGGVQGEVDLFADSVDLILALGIDLSDLPVGRLLAYRARIRDLAWRGYAAEVAAAAGAAATFRSLELALGRWVRSDASSWAQRVTAGPAPTGLAGCNSTLSLWKLYAEHVPGKAPYHALTDGPPETAEQRLRALGEDGERFLQAVGKAARHFGSRAVYGGPTWDEDPSFVWSTLARCGPALAAAPPEERMSTTRSRREQAMEELMGKLRASWKWRVTRVLTGQVVDMRRRMLRRLAADASRFLSLRERAKASLLVLGGEERRIIVEGARRLVASGLLAGAPDVELLTDGELERMLLGEEPVSPEELARRRQALVAAGEGEPLPDVFEGLPGVEEEPPVEGDVLLGWAASGGKARGPA
ncbi:MAG: PEP/pyruvate-binding domain-containing protein, partial [Actinobacteria bacterium]|nr:PEP/pyruvate-binding domain-containing protein [Actinomycetota bacterium]